MTTAKEHKLNFEQFMEDIKEKIRANLLKERQKIIGFSASEAATNALEYLLHKNNLITPGFRVNHKYFASEKRAKRYLEFEFPKKEEIIKLMVKQDEYRTLLCYGKEKDTRLVEEAIKNLNRIKKLIEEETGEEL